MNATPEPIPKLGLAELDPAELPHLEVVVRNSKSEIIASIGVQICTLVVSPEICRPKVPKLKTIKHSTWSSLIRLAMAECYRILKPGRWLSLCYHDTSEGTWTLIQDIMAEVGFLVDKTDQTIFIDTGQKSYNQLIADKVTKRDLVINFRKPKPRTAPGALPRPTKRNSKSASSAQPAPCARSRASPSCWTKARPSRRASSPIRTARWPTGYGRPVAPVCLRRARRSSTWDEKCRQILSRLGSKNVIDRHDWFWLTLAEGASRELTLYENDEGTELVLALYRHHILDLPPGPNPSAGNELYGNSW